jgi:hypothetical protein
MLSVYHQGSTAGYYSSIFLLPETQSAVIILTNSIALCDAADYLGQATIQAIFDFEDPVDYPEVARYTSQRLIALYDTLQSDIERQRKPGHLPRRLDAYTGRYWNRLHNFVTEIKLHERNSALLQLAFQGLPSQLYDLRPMDGDTFEWALTLDEDSRRGRYHTWNTEFYKMRFVSKGGGISGLKWAYDPRNFPDGQLFDLEE